MISLQELAAAVPEPLLWSLALHGFVLVLLLSALGFVFWAMSTD